MIRNAFPIPNSATLIFSLPIPVTAPVFANGDNTANLRADGWRVLEKSDRQDRLPGSTPYEKLPQVIQSQSLRPSPGRPTQSLRQGLRQPEREDQRNLPR